MDSLVLATQRGHLTVAERLTSYLDWKSISASTEPNDNNTRLLFLVGATCGWVEIIRELLDRGFQPDLDTFKKWQI